ncbi:BTAD domain-containing putative transcriptional regulator [Nonomuraea sp. NPDC050643]|uniref:AfsR/SARP family transcriptional regulator n=1 Tax=Nonomuraea sp. NPDC050643 TaxID=3155660 RepID=UPI0033E434E5
MYFSVLGPVRVRRDDVEVPAGAPQQRLLLALLLAHAGQPVPLDEIIEVMWGQDPPASAVNIVHRHVGMVRRLLEPGLPRMAAGRWLLPESGGYRLDVGVETLDLLAFRHLLTQAREAGRDGRPERAVERYAEALGLWRAPTTAGLPAEVQGHAVFAALDRERLAAAKEAADAALRYGLVAPLLPGLQRLADEHPLDEPLQSRVVLALWATGHQAAALEAYERARARLADELGVDPSPELRAAHLRALNARPVPATPDEGPAGVGTAPAHEGSGARAAEGRGGDGSTTPAAGGRGRDGSGAPVARAVPAQLPVDLAAFVGRRHELARVVSLLPGDERVPPATEIQVIGGMAGIGKTTLAVHLAHQVAHRFPDGQLYVNLRGFGPSGTAVDPAEAIRGFLQALGTDQRHVPAGLEARSGLYRTLLSGRRMLIVLDNARDVGQVRPLLPGTAGCLVLVTSRDRLSGLVARDGARPLTLDLLSGTDAREFLARRLGEARLAREPRAVEDIVERCGRLPLALAIVAARAAMNPTFPLTAVAAELRATAGHLDAFADPDAAADVRAVFSWSYRALSPDAARLFRLLSLHPGPDIALPATASLAGVPVRRARSLTAELAHAHLVTEHVSGRYVLHDLLRVYAAELADAHDPPEEQAAARRRNLDHYLHTAHAAARSYTKTLVPVQLPRAEPGVTPEAVADHRRALAWFHDERPVLLEVIPGAAAGGHHRHTWQLVWALEFFFDRLGHWDEALALARTAMDSAARLHDPTALAHAHRGLARACNLLRRDDDSRTHLRLALELFRQAGDVNGHASTLHYLGFLAERLGHNEEALRSSEQALALYEAADDRLGQAMTLNSIGYLHGLLGHPGTALPFCRQALRLFQELDDPHGEAAAWDSLGHTHYQLGELQEAISCYLSSLDLFRAQGSRRFEAVILDHLGDARHEAGELDAARHAWQDAITLYREIDPPAADRIRPKLAAVPRQRSAR